MFAMYLYRFDNAQHAFGIAALSARSSSLIAFRVSNGGPIGTAGLYR